MTESAYALQVRHGDLWLTVKGADYDELYSNAVIALGQGPAEAALEALAKPRSAEQAAANVAAAGLTPAAPEPPVGPPPGLPQPPAAAPGPPAFRPAAQAPAQPAASGGGDDWKAAAPYCTHGQRRGWEDTVKSGPRTGEPRYTYFCGAPKGTPREQQCQPIDAVTGKEWGSR